MAQGEACARDELFKCQYRVAARTVDCGRGFDGCYGARSSCSRASASGNVIGSASSPMGSTSHRQSSLMHRDHFRRGTPLLSFQEALEYLQDAAQLDRWDYLLPCSLNSNGCRMVWQTSVMSTCQVCVALAAHCTNQI